MDKLPLQNILRQLLCGAVFFASIGVLLPEKAKDFVNNAHISDSVTFWLGCAFVMSLTVGTLIYHIEKNFYSYAVQILMDKSCTKKTKSGDRTYPSILVRALGLWGIGLTIPIFVALLLKEAKVQHAKICLFVGGSCLLSGCVVIFTKFSDVWKVVFGFLISVFGVVVLVKQFCNFNIKSELLKSDTLTIIISIVLIAGFVFLLCMLRCRNIREIAEHTRQLWLMEDLGGESDPIRGKANSVIMRRVANWSDFIHCGQCCAFAWILGSYCVLCYCLLDNQVNNPLYGRINIGLLCSLLLLSLELIADWHRYHHVLYVLNNNENGEI